MPVITGDVLLFGDIADLDTSIMQKLETVYEAPAIVVCKVGLPPGDMFKLPGEEYGIYLVTKDEEGRMRVCGMRVRNRDGRIGRNIVLQAIKMTMSALEVEEPRLFEFAFRTDKM